MPTSTKPPERTINDSRVGVCLEWLVSLVLIFVCVGSPPPGINESHYIPKAKRVWDPSFAAGQDLFLNSNDSHFLASLAAGQLAKLFEFESVAWIGRCACWLLLTFAWQHLARTLGIAAVLRALTLAAWILLVRYGHFAGEWFVGGFEAKSMAYPLALVGLSLMIQQRWSWSWVWLGAAMAFHPVVGGWIIITVFPIWLSLPNLRQRIGEQAIGIVAGAAISFIGILPALGGFGSPDRQGAVSAAQVHAYHRLAHHMCPRMFEHERWWAAGCTLLLWFTSLVVWVRMVGREQFKVDSKDSSTASRRQRLWRFWLKMIDLPVGRIAAIALASLVICFLGWAIDLLGAVTGQTILAAKLLRFYWFRWSDIAVPMSIVVMIACTITQVSFGTGSTSLKCVSRRGSYLITTCIVIVGLAVFFHWRHESSQLLSPADRWLMERPGPFPVRHDPEHDFDKLPQRFQEWLAVCQWIRENSPGDSLWLTPKHQQTFKWYAQRAEVVSWKDVPQDNASIIEWYRRAEGTDEPGVLSCAPPRNPDGSFRGWTTAELIALAKKYRFNWILIDRTYQDAPPLLECKYPLDIDNRSFAIFYVSDAMLNTK